MDRDCDRDKEFEEATKWYVRDFLSERFGLFREGHFVDVIGTTEKFQIAYGNERVTSENTTRMIVDFFLGAHCDILDFRIQEDSRRMGHGRRLYECVEDIARSYDCNRAITKPSGQGLEFWGKMDFFPEDDAEMGMWEKLLLS